jgi:hypothetical protein
MITRFLSILILASAASAQPRAVLAKAEPHHHPVYEDATMRVLRVRVPAHDSTLLHQHDPDYFWIALGPSTIVNAKPGVADATITSQNLSIHYTPGKFAHVARNPGTVPFDNITVELLKPQSDLKSLCSLVTTDALACPKDQRPGFTGASGYDSFETKQLRVSLLTIAAGKTVKPSVPAHGTWIIALDTLDTKSAKSLSVDAGGKWVGGALHTSSAAWSLTNHTTHEVRALAVVERD